MPETLATLSTYWAIRQEDLHPIITADIANSPNPVESREGESGASYVEREREFAKQFEEKLSIRDGVASLDVVGPLMPNPSIGARFFLKAADNVRIAQLIRSAAGNPDVDALVLNINSPGGTVVGTPEMASALQAFNATGKTSIACAPILMASAAYWLGSQATHVIVGESAIIGSVGVIRPHVDMSSLYKKIGYSVEIFRGGDYKVPGAMGTAMTDKQRSHIQHGIDEVHSEFQGSVNHRRMVDLKDMQGQVFSGKDSIAVGMADAVGIDMGAAAGAAIEILVDNAKVGMTPAEQKAFDEANASLALAQTELASATENLSTVTAERDELLAAEPDDAQLKAVEAERDTANANVETETARAVAAEAEVAQLKADAAESAKTFDADVASKVESLAAIKAAEIAASTGTGELATGTGADRDEDDDPVAGMSSKEKWAECARLEKEEGGEASRAFYVEHIKGK